ncbi:DUF131 domain-containing protein [Candidatus Bathyarchaeota archaeon]|nr:DUF131 domain-containing protein [Candidatus Bathyarchaeota archaeon]
MFEVMAVSSSLVFLGLLMVGIGVLLVWFSYRPREGGRHAEGRVTGVFFIGPVPIVVGGEGGWRLAGVVALIAFVFVVAVVVSQPGVMGG